MGVALRASFLGAAIGLLPSSSFAAAVQPSGPSAPRDPDAPVATTAPAPLEPAAARPSPAKRSAFNLPAAKRDDPYGPRPSTAPKLTLDQILRFAQHNPATLAANAEVDIFEAQLRKLKFAWVPIVTTETSLMPGVYVECDDVVLDDGSATGFDFQYCRSSNDPDFDVNTVRGYFQQLRRAGVRFEFRADILFPITGFGKLVFAKRAAKAGVAIKKLQTLATQQELTLQVYRAFTALLLARESIAILRDANDIVIKAEQRVEAGLGGSDDWDTDADAADLERDPDDLHRVKLAAIDVEEHMREALKVESLALSALWALTGDAAPRGFDIAADRLTQFGVKGGLRSLSDYKNLAVRNRPEARMAAGAVEARQAQERLARAMFLPDLGIVVRTGVARSSSADPQMSQLYYQDGFNFSRFTAALALRWRWDFHLKWFDLQAARATRRVAEFQREVARLMLGRDVEQAFADYVEASHRVRLLDDAIALAWKLVVSAELKDSSGGGDAGELLRAVEKWYRRQFDYMEAVHTHNEALARLSRAVGASLIDPAIRRTGSAARAEVDSDGH